MTVLWRIMIFSVALLFSTAGNAEINILGNPPPFIRSYLLLLGKKADTRGPLTVSFEPCGEVNAAYTTNGVIICSELVEKAVGHYKQSERAGAPNAISEKVLYGQILGPVLHEIGHALIQRHGLAFTGREEDACDQFAAWLIMRQNSMPMYVGALNTFVSPFPRRINNQQLSDEHSLSKQRVVQLVCWGYGRDPAVFQSIAANEGITPHRLSRCGSEYQQLMSNTPKIFRPAIDLSN